MKVSKLKLVLATNRNFTEKQLICEHCPGEFLANENMLDCGECEEDCIECWHDEIELEELFNSVKVEEKSKIPKQWIDKVYGFFMKKEK